MIRRNVNAYVYRLTGHLRFMSKFLNLGRFEMLFHLYILFAFFIFHFLSLCHVGGGITAGGL